MPFVYIHITWFSCWIGSAPGYPYGLLTMIVSLEAIFLSTFLMISQNRADAKRCVRSSTSRMRFTPKSRAAGPLDRDRLPPEGRPTSVSAALAAGNVAVAAVWHSRRARFVVQLTTTERR